MTCSIPDCQTIAERNGICARHNREARRAESDALKPKKVYRIPKESEKRKIERPIYNREAKQFIIDNPECQLKIMGGCTGKSNQVHHSKRRGKYYLDKSTWLACCQYCHDQVEFVLSAKENRERGFLK